ncbi:hypothetical protein HKD37_05G013142 [Glycine soja]
MSKPHDTITIRSLWPPCTGPHHRRVLPREEYSGIGARRHRPPFPVPPQQRPHVVTNLLAKRRRLQPSVVKPRHPPRRRLAALHGLRRRARHQVHHRPPCRSLQHQPLVARLHKTLVQSIEVNPKPPQTFLKAFHELVTVDPNVQISLLLHHRHNPRLQRLQRRYQRVAVVSYGGNRMQPVHTIHSQSFILFDIKFVEIELGEISVMMNDVELKRNAHEPREFLHPRSDFLHYALNGITRSTRDNGGQAQMRCFIAPCGQRFQKRWPLGAISVADV